MVGILCAQSNTRAIVEPEPSFRGLLHQHLEPLMPPQAFNTLVVSPPSRISEQSCDAATTVSAILASQFDHVGNQAIFFGATFWGSTLC